VSVDFQKAIQAKELPPGGMKTVRVGGEYVLLVNTEGKYYGMGAICTHEEWDLSEGSLDGHFVTCAGHGSVWDLTKGTAEFEEPLDPEPLYEVVERDDGFLYVRRKG
jgi:nitrite reductase/ring-hydroxylating ferredoxin subunit